MWLPIKASPHWVISEILANQYVAEVGVRKEKSLNIEYSSKQCGPPKGQQASKQMQSSHEEVFAQLRVTLKQVPITRRHHLPYKPFETTFSCVFLFLETV